MRLPAVLASYVRALTGVSVALLPTLLHASEPGKAVEDALSSWSSTIHVRKPDEVLGSWLQPGMAVHGVNGHMEDLSLSPSLSTLSI